MPFTSHLGDIAAIKAGEHTEQAATVGLGTRTGLAPAACRAAQGEAVGTPPEGLERLRAATASGERDRVCTRLDAGIVVVLGSAVDPERLRARVDLDVAGRRQRRHPAPAAHHVTTR